MHQVDGADVTDDPSDPAGAGTPPARARVVVVDDDAIVREGLRVLLPTFPEHHQVIASYSHVEPMLAERPEADIAIVDLELQRATERGLSTDLREQLALVGLKLSDAGLTTDQGDGGASRPRVGVAAVRAVCEAGYKALVYSGADNRIVLASCLAAGASGVAHKVDPLESLSQTISQMLGGEIVLTPSLVGLAEVFERRDLLPDLSPRQREVLESLAKGNPQKWVARDLGVTVKTVEYHWSQTKNKFVEALRGLSPGRLQRILGLGPVDLIGNDPCPD